MKINVKPDELFTRIADLMRIVDATVGEAVTISADAGGLVTIRADNSHNIAELRVDAEVVDPGTAAASFGTLQQACTPFLCRGVTVSISADALYLTLSFDVERIRMQTFAPIPQPGRLADDVPRAKFTQHDILAVLEPVVHAICADSTRPALRGAALELGPDDAKLRAVATDGRRLAVAAVAPIAHSAPPNFAAFLPRRAVEFISRVVPPASADVTICQRPGRTIVVIGDNYGSFETPASEFPAWRKCMPVDPPLRAAFDCPTLASALCHAINGLDSPEVEDVDEFGEPMEPTFNARIVAASSGESADITIRQAADIGDDTSLQYCATVPCSVKDTPDLAPLDVIVNARFLLEAVRGHLGTVTISAANFPGGQFGPLLLRFTGDPSPVEVLEVIMPIRTA